MSRPILLRFGGGGGWCSAARLGVVYDSGPLQNGVYEEGGFGWSRSGQMAACKLTPSIPVLIVEPLFNAMQE